MPPQPQQPKQPANNQPQNPAAQTQSRVIEGFDPRGFAKNLAMEAAQVVPENIKEPDKKFIVEIIHKFCLLCGDALVKDEKFNLNAQQAGLITQFIGEWTFHKSVDLINGGIPPELREGVLQKIAFTVFEIAKQAISKNLPQEQVISVIEVQVKNTFKAALEELKKRGKINDVVLKNAENQSSIDDMTKQEYEKEHLGEDLSDAKISKLASLALLVRKLPKERVDALVEKIGHSEAQVLLQFIKMPHLEDKIDRGITIRCLSEIKEVLPEPKVISKDRIFSKLFKIVKTGNKNKISNIIDNERPMIKQFVLSPYTKEESNIPTRVGAVVCKYLEEKLLSDDNKEEKQ